MEKIRQNITGLYVSHADVFMESKKKKTDSAKSKFPMKTTKA